jgi:hypothetical protein
MLRTDVRGYTQQKNKCYTFTPSSPPISGTKRNTSKHAGGRGAQVEHKRNKVEQQVEQTGEQPRETGHFLAKTGIFYCARLSYIEACGEKGWGILVRAPTSAGRTRPPLFATGPSRKQPAIANVPI